MIAKKQYLKSKPVCKVTFKLSKEESKGASNVALVGDFNEWNTDALPMKKLKNGEFTATLELDKDNAYQFRYLLDGNQWENDWNADEYAQSPVSYDENSVVRV